MSETVWEASLSNEEHFNTNVIIGQARGATPGAENVYRKILQSKQSEVTLCNISQIDMGS